MEMATMTADARPLFTPASADLAARIGSLGDRPRLFASRLGPGRPHARPGNFPTGDAGRAWLLSLLWVQHAYLEHRIAEEGARPRPDAGLLCAHKREKLAIRDRIASRERRA
jgi:hypothetical protein